jgi:heme A synthase
MSDLTPEDNAELTRQIDRKHVLLRRQATFLCVAGALLAVLGVPIWIVLAYVAAHAALLLYLASFVRKQVAAAHAAGWQRARG